MKAAVDKKEFYRVVKALKPFTRVDNDKMQYIYINVENGEARFEALDGHKIAVEYLECITDDNFNAYIKPIMLLKTKADYITIELIGDKAYLTDGEFSFGFKQPEGEWYDTKKMINTYEENEIKSAIGVNPNFLMDALKNTKSNSYRDTVKIEIRDKVSPIVIRSTKDKRNVRLVLPVKIAE